MGLERNLVAVAARDWSTQPRTQLAYVTKKWAGLGRELFTSADNYVIAITDLNSANSPAAAALLLAAGLAIDIVFKEAKG
jgi:hypothetical protein